MNCRSIPGWTITQPKCDVHDDDGGLLFVMVVDDSGGRGDGVAGGGGDGNDGDDGYHGGRSSLVVLQMAWLGSGKFAVLFLLKGIHSSLQSGQHHEDLIKRQSFARKHFFHSLIIFPQYLPKGLVRHN
jgi:hypothetical protein